MVQALQAYSPQVQVAPSPQVAPAQVSPQWQSTPQLVNPYLSTGQIPQYSHPQQFAPTPTGWMQATTQQVVAPQYQPNPVQDYLALNSVPSHYSQNLTSQQPQLSPQYSPKLDLNAPSGRDSQGNPLASVIELINSFGNGSPELAIARIHQQLIHREDQLGEVVAYTQALEKEAIQMGNILSTPENTGYWLQYQEFHLAQLPEVINFRNAYPQATFEQYYDYLVKSNQPQLQPQYQGEPSVQPTFNQMDMGVGNGAASQGGGRGRMVDVLRYLDTNHFGQAISQLA